jgi:hypothetical protein
MAGSRKEVDMARPCITVKTRCGLKAAAIVREAQECPMHDPPHSYYLYYTYFENQKIIVYEMLHATSGHPDTIKDAVWGHADEYIQIPHGHITQKDHGPCQ